jgi:hypothetical protein
LIAPPVIGVGFFVAISLVARANGDLNRYTIKALLACGGLVAFAGYLLFWSDEIRKLWSDSPSTAIICGTLVSIIPIGLFAWIWHVQMLARQERSILNSNTGEVTASGGRIMPAVARWVFLIWGLVNLIGVAAMIIDSLLSRTH